MKIGTSGVPLDSMPGVCPGCAWCEGNGLHWSADLIDLPDRTELAPGITFRRPRHWWQFWRRPRSRARGYVERVQTVAVVETKIRGVRIDDDLWEAAQAKAKRRRETVAAVIKRALLAYVEEDK